MAFIAATKFMGIILTRNGLDLCKENKKTTEDLKMRLENTGRYSSEKNKQCKLSVFPIHL